MVSLFAAACVGLAQTQSPTLAPAASQSTSSPSAAPTASATMQTTATIEPRATTVPAVTPEPTNATARTAAIDVVAAFKSAGLEAESPQALTKKDYGLAPYVCSGTRFLVPSLGADKSGRIFICPNADDLALLKDYYDKLGRASAMFFSWTFVKGLVLVQINGDLEETVANKYKTALESMHQ